MDKEEAEKSKKIVLEYFNKLQKISEEQIKKIFEVKERLHMKIFKIEELHSITKFFEEKMAEMKILSEEIIKSLEKGEKTAYVKDLESNIETRSNEIKDSLRIFLRSAKVHLK